MKFSITPYCFHMYYYAGQMDVFRLIETVKYRYRLDAVDMWNPMFLSFDEDYLGKIRDTLRREDMTLNNYAIDGANIWDPDSEIRKRNADFYIKNVKAAEFLGAKSVKVDTGSNYLPHFHRAWDYDEKILARNRSSYPAEPSKEQEAEFEKNRFYTDEMIEYFRIKLGEYCKRADSMGYDIVLENHWGPMCVADELVKVIKACDNPRLGILAHLGRWFEPGAGNAEAIAAPYTKYIHIDRKSGDSGEHLSEMAKPYIDAGFKGRWGIEYTEKNEDEFALVEFIIASAKRHIGKLLV